MKQEPREAAAESYSTFWDETPTRATTSSVAPEDAYSTFINLVEDGPFSAQRQPDGAD